MIFDSSDLQVLNRIVIRKGCETAAATFDHSLDETQRMLKVEVLVGQINYARNIAAIIGNSLEGFGAQVALIESGCPPLPPTMFSSYLDSLSRSETEDEGRFVWMIRELDAQLPILREALAIFEDGGADCRLTDTDVVTIRRVRDLMTRVRERCDGQDEEVLGDARDYIDVTLGECSVLLRTASLASVGCDEISDIAICMGAVTPDSFDRLFLDTLEGRELESLSRFRAGSGRYVAAMYAKCVFNCAYPDSTGFRRFPVRGKNRPPRLHPWGR